MRRAPRRLSPISAALALLLALLAACSVPGEVAAPDGAKPAPPASVSADSHQPGHHDADDAAPPVNEPAPQPAAARKADAAASRAGVGEVDYTCRSDADCTVKDVGNCCGYYPACVNVDSPTFPEQVKAACAASGTSGVCGFPSIGGCACVQGRCEAKRAGFMLEDGPAR